MANQSVTLSVPEDIYVMLKRRAEQTQRSVEAELLEVLAKELPTATTTTIQDSAIPASLRTELDAMVQLNDKALWKAARSHLSAKDAAKLEALHHKSHAKSLTYAELQTKDELLRQYNYYMRLRARAAVLLKQRGYDVSNCPETQLAKVG